MCVCAYNCCLCIITMCSCRVIFNEVIQTSKHYMRDITVVSIATQLHPTTLYIINVLSAHVQIKPEWLYELAPHFYQYGTVSCMHVMTLERIVTRCTVCVCAAGERVGRGQAEEDRGTNCHTNLNVCNYC